MTGAAYAIHSSRPESEVRDDEAPSSAPDGNRQAAQDDRTRPAARGELEDRALRRWANTPIPSLRRPWSSSFPG
jgi:hypothetical protein